MKCRVAIPVKLVPEVGASLIGSLIAAAVLAAGFFVSSSANAQTAVGACMDDLLRRGISERNAAIACSGQSVHGLDADLLRDCVRQNTYQTFTAVSRFSNGDYDYGGELQLSHPEYLKAAGCSSRICSVGPSITVRVSNDEALNTCLYDQYPQTIIYEPYPRFSW